MLIVHIFKKEFREIYELEKLWGDARSIRLEDIIMEKKKK